MLVYNKYLKELGVKKNSFPFDREGDSRYELDKKCGVVDAQTWSMDNTIIYELYTYLRYFQEYCTKGIPAPFIDETKEDHGAKAFGKVTQEIIDGLKAYLEIDDLSMDMFKNDHEAYTQARNELWEKFWRGWKLLGRYLSCYWW